MISNKVPCHLMQTASVAVRFRVAGLLLCNHLAGEEGASCFTLIVFLPMA